LIFLHIFFLNKKFFFKDVAELQIKDCMTWLKTSEGLSALKTLILHFALHLTFLMILMAEAAIWSLMMELLTLMASKTRFFRKTRLVRRIYIVIISLDCVKKFQIKRENSSNNVSLAFFDTE